MSKHSEIEEPLSRLAILPTFAAAIGTVLALVAIVAALIIAAVYPTINGHVIAVAIAMGIGVIVLAVIIASAVLYRLRLPTSNDDWVFW